MKAHSIRVLLVLGLTLVALTPLVARPATVQAQQGTLARPLHAVTAGGVPLASRPLLNPVGVNTIPPGNSANHKGQPITHGLQLQGWAGTPGTGVFRLGGHFSRLYGNAYLDDASWRSPPSPTIGIYDIGHRPR